MKLSLSTIDYKIEHYSPTLYLIGRDHNFKRQIVIEKNFLPYFYVRREDVKIQDLLLNFKYKIRWIEDTKLESQDGYQLIKIVTYSPPNVGKLRRYLESKGIKTYEADILFPLRYMIDNDIRSGVEYDSTLDIIIPVQMPSRLRYLIIDIETLSEEEPDPDKHEVIVVGLYDSLTDRYYIFSRKSFRGIKQLIKEYQLEKHKYELIYKKNEETFLKAIISKFIELEPDVIISFTEFDMIFLLKRMQKYKLNIRQISPMYITRVRSDGVKISGVQILDAQFMYTQIKGVPKWASLDSISLTELGIGRIFHDIPVYRAWNSKNYRNVILRNYRDVELTKMINDSCYLLAYFDEIKRTIGSNLSDTLFASRIQDILHLRHCKGELILQTKSPMKKIPYKGSRVFESNPGVYTNILVLDWAEMYSAFIELFNISYDTFLTSPRKDLKTIKIYDEHYTRTDKIGWTPSILKELRPLRRKYKKEMKKAEQEGDLERFYSLKVISDALKGIIHASYGGYGQAGDWEHRIPAARLYHPPVAESITYPGRKIQDMLREFLPELNYEIIYGDTDSTFIKLKTKNIEKEAEKLKNLLNKKASEFIKNTWNIEAKGVELEIDSIYERLILMKKKGEPKGAKKRYFGRNTHGRKVIKGIEIVRSDTPELTAEVQRTLIDWILEKENIGMIKEFITQVGKGFKEYPLNKIAIPAIVSKKPKAYKTFSRNLQSYLYANKVLGLNIKLGERFLSIYIKRIPRQYSQDISTIIKGELRTRLVNIIGFRTREDIPDGFEIDYDTMKDKILIEKTEEFLNVLKIPEEEINQVFKEIKGIKTMNNYF